MSNDKKPFKLPINFDIDIKDIKDRKILEFVPHTIKPDEAQIVRVSNWGWSGLQKTTFVVLNKGGNELIIERLKEIPEEE